MAAWDNYKRLKAAGKVTLEVQETVVGGVMIKTLKTAYDPETGTQREPTTEVTPIEDGKAQEARLNKELASVLAWLTDGQAVIDAWYAAQNPPVEPPAAQPPPEG
jgi:hypothetical protein